LLQLPQYYLSQEKAGGRTAYIFFNNTATLAAINNAMELQRFLAD